MIAPARSKTLNVPPEPVVIVAECISWLKNATTVPAVDTPCVLGAGTTVTVGVPSGTPTSGAA